MAKKTYTKTNGNANGQSKVYDMVTNMIIEKLEEGVIPWQIPWSQSRLKYPKNFISNKNYRGSNIFMLSLISSIKCYQTNNWITYKQATEKGGHIKKGEKGMPVIFWKWIKKENEDGKEDTFPCIRYYTVFNLDQTEGIDYEAPKIITRNFNPIVECEKLVHNMQNQPFITHNESRAYYKPSQDTVNMPKSNLFVSDQKYYSTLFHELTHSTGHESRLNRHKEIQDHMFGSQDYSKEELIAEMGASFLCGIAGIDSHTIDNSASYIDAWLKELRGDNKLIIQAAAKAQHAVDYIINVKFDD